MRFFVLGKPKADSPEDRLGRSDAIREEGFNVGDALQCPSCNRFLSSLTWLPPFRIELESWGKHYADIADFGNEFIVSKRFRDAFNQHGLRGLESFEPVEVMKVTHRRPEPQGPLPHYFKATVAHSSTSIDQQASGYVWEDDSEICPECLMGSVFKRRERLVIKEETWDGNDVFYPRGGGGPVVSERFQTLFQEQGFVGVVFIPVENDYVDFYP